MLIKGMRLTSQEQRQYDCSQRYLEARKDAPGCRRPRRGGSGVGTFQEEQSETVLESRGTGRGLQGRGSPAGPDALGSLANDTPPFRQQEGRWVLSQPAFITRKRCPQMRPDLTWKHLAGLGSLSGGHEVW